jgi:putative ABC transport system permease protein
MAGNAESTLRFYEGITERIEGLAGVESAGLVQTLPISGGGWVMKTILEDSPAATGQVPEVAYWRVVSPRYLETLGVRRLQGRSFVPGDRKGAVEVAVVNEAFAESFWPGEEAVGRRFRMPFEGDAGWITVIGLIEDTRHLGLRQDPAPTVYRPQAQALDALVGVGNRQQALVVRTREDAAVAGLAVLRALRTTEPDLVVADPATMEERLSRALSEPRITATALVLFATTALLLAVIGLVGMVSRSVAERAPEIALRRVLGAQGRDVLRLVLVRTLVPVGVGLVIGAGAGLAATRSLSAMLFEVRPSDPWVLVATILLLGGVALLAGYLPARKAIRVEPVSALE